MKGENSPRRLNPTRRSNGYLKPLRPLLLQFVGLGRAGRRSGRRSGNLGGAKSSRTFFLCRSFARGSAFGVRINGPSLTYFTASLRNRTVLPTKVILSLQHHRSLLVVVAATSPNLSFLFKILSTLSTEDMVVETVAPNRAPLCFIFSKSSAETFLGTLAAAATSATFAAAAGDAAFLSAAVPKRAARASFELSAPLEVLTPYFSALNLSRSASVSSETGFGGSAGGASISLIFFDGLTGEKTVLVADFRRKRFGISAFEYTAILTFGNQ